MKYPYKEEKISDNTFIRTFNKELDSSQFYWHRDKEDRIIESIGETDWMFQFDNKLPQRIEDKIFIPKGVFHRLIKGNDDLRIKLIKI
jgi:hypothetical protein